MSIQTQLITAAELAAMDDTDDRVELVKGHILREAPAGFGHGAISVKITAQLYGFVEQHGLGQICAAETGFVLARDPDTVRAPDAAFVAGARISPASFHAGFFNGAPDLAVEVVSPEDSSEEVEAKVQDYLDAGTRLVWIVYPRTRTVVVHEPGGTSRRLSAGDTLDGGTVLPGLAVPVASVFV